MKILILIVFVIVSTNQIILGQQPQNQNLPNNSSVSGFGTSFIFSPSPICSTCIQTEMGILKQQILITVPIVITYAPRQLSSADITIMFDSLSKTNDYSVGFGTQLEILLRKQIMIKKDWVGTIAPRGSIQLREGGVSTLGATFAVQYAKGKNVFVSNLTGRKLFNSSSWLFQNSFDYSRIIHKSGLNFFVGFQQTLTRNQKLRWDIEQGIAIPIKNTQIEFALTQLNINNQRIHQLQTRLLINWGRISH